MGGDVKENGIGSIWCEVLPNLNLLNLVVLFRDPPPSSLEIKRSQVKFYFKDGSSSMCQLPRKVRERTVRIMPITGGCEVKLELSERIRETHWTPLNQEDELENAPQLQATQDIECRFCRTSLMLKKSSEDGPYFQYSGSLPSEYWHELIDYWACHKEDFSKLPGQKDGFVLAQKGAIISNMSSILLHAKDVDYSAFIIEESILKKDRITSALTRFNLRCSRCKHLLGECGILKSGLDQPPSLKSDMMDNCCGVKLNRVWCNIIICHNSCEKNRKLKALMPRNYFTYKFLELCDAYAQYRFVFCGECSNSRILLFIWVLGLNLTLYLPSNEGNFKDPIKCMKILYSRVKNYGAENSRISKTQQMWLEDEETEKIDVEIFLLEQIIDDLNNSNKFLPPQKKKINNWKIGLLSYDIHK